MINAIEEVTRTLGRTQPLIALCRARIRKRLMQVKGKMVSSSGLINENPTVYEKKERRTRAAPSSSAVFDEDIKDPEHPYSLEELNVITEDAIEVNDRENYVRVTFTPTVEHCSMATVIGLCLRVKLMRSLPPRFKVCFSVAPGSHATEAAVNKQLNDKERVAAALENPNLVDMVDECLAPSYQE
ncbi:protein AE7-like [Rutidosis leptorrhynchoides]|uniref:protein AE7-like n=1 Tax=Rutidosis leptorrhynchoides TaxID=125765 RepID=UPI003A99B6C0